MGPSLYMKTQCTIDNFYLLYSRFWEHSGSGNIAVMVFSTDVIAQRYLAPISVENPQPLVKFCLQNKSGITNRFLVSLLSILTFLI